MLAKLVGLIEKEGVFEGKPYHSIKLHLIAQANEEGFFGMRVLDPKYTSIKYDRLSFIFGKPMDKQMLVDLVGDEIDVHYDDNKHIVGIRPVENNKPPEKKQ